MSTHDAKSPADKAREDIKTALTVINDARGLGIKTDDYWLKTHINYVKIALKYNVRARVYELVDYNGTEVEIKRVDSLVALRGILGELRSKTGSILKDLRQMTSDLLQPGDGSAPVDCDGEIVVVEALGYKQLKQVWENLQPPNPDDNS